MITFESTYIYTKTPSLNKNHGFFPSKKPQQTFPRYPFPVEALAIGVNRLLRQFLTTSTSGMDGEKRLALSARWAPYQL